jgi:hypothetical protein
MPTSSVILSSGALIMTSEVPKSSQPATAGRRENVALTVPQNIDIIRRLTNSSS